MALFWGVVAYVIYLYIIIVLARVVIETTRQFSRSWRPGGVAAVPLELVYVLTDPPIRALRRLVPPLRLGNVSLDLSVIIVLIALIALRVVALAFTQ